MLPVNFLFVREEKFIAELVSICKFFLFYLTFLIVVIITALRIKVYRPKTASFAHLKLQIKRIIRKYKFILRNYKFIIFVSKITKPFKTILAGLL